MERLYGNKSRKNSFSSVQNQLFVFLSFFLYSFHLLNSSMYVSHWYELNLRRKIIKYKKFWEWMRNDGSTMHMYSHWKWITEYILRQINKWMCMALGTLNSMEVTNIPISAIFLSINNKWLHPSFFCVFFLHICMPAYHHFFAVIFSLSASISSLWSLSLSLSYFAFYSRLVLLLL